MKNRRWLIALVLLLGVVITARSLGNLPPSPIVTITAPTLITSSSAAITVEWCSQSGELDPETRQVWLSTGDSTAKFDYEPGTKSGCVDFATSSATLTLTPGIYSITALIKNLAGNQGSGYHSQLVYSTPPMVTLVTPAANGANGRAIVRSRFPLILATYSANLGIDTSSLVVTVGGDTVTPLVRRQTRLMEWEVDSLRQFVPGDSNDITVRICDPYASCTTVTRRAVLDNSGAPVVQFDGMPLEDLGRVAAMPVGPGLLVSAGDVETGMAVPGYVARASNWTTGLVYSQRTSHPRALVNVNIELTWPAGTPDQIKSVLIDGAVRMDSLVENNTNCTADAGRLCTVALQADFAATSFTRPTRKWLKVEVTVTSGGVSKVSTDSVEVVLVDNRRSAYGSGWAVAGVSRIDTSGADVILTGPTGLATIFRGSGGVYLAPPGDHRTLVYTDGVYTLTSRGIANAWIQFDSSGRLTNARDNNYNTMRFTYVPGTFKIDSVIDPTGHAFRLTYTDSTRVTITDPGGRQSIATINNSHQLVYDSVASPAARRSARTYSYASSGSNNAITLSARTDAAGSRTAIAYSARWRFVRDTLPAVLPETGSTLVKPIVTFTAQEIRNLGNLHSRDSYYGSLRDPRGNLIRSYLNRWGDAWWVRDSVGTISKASFLADGRVAWSRGKHDSTRVYSTYDAFGRVTRVFRRRTTSDTVRLDSLIYDSQHRVIKRIGPLGLQDSTRYAYDSNGNLITVTDPLGYVNRTWYRSDGLVDSTRGPLVSSSTVYSYDATWKNLSQVLDADGNVALEHRYDDLGRPDMAEIPAALRKTMIGSTQCRHAWSSSCSGWGAGQYLAAAVALGVE